MRARAIAGVVGAAVLASCAAPPATDRIEAEEALRSAAEAYHTAAAAKDVQAVVALYVDDAIMIPPNSDLVEGIAGVRQYRFGFIETAGVELEFELIRIEVAEGGDLGWTLAIGDITINRPEGPPGRDRVRDFHTWRRQPDGAWKVVVDVWNSGSPVG